MLKALWQKLSGRQVAGPEPSEPVLYKGYEIIAAPVAVGGQYRVSGTLRKIDGAETAVPFDRADTLPDRAAAVRMTRLKAERYIEEMM